ncbi:hypothetical protein NTJ01_001231 [Vibrio cholerae]
MSESSVVEVWLSVKRYRLIVKHRILAELGEISHFILNILHKYDLSLLAIYEITGLDEHQLKPVIERLQGLNFMSEDLQLTESGRIAAYALNHLHGKAIEVYMDQNYVDYSSSWFIALSDSDAIKSIPSSAIQVATPGKKKSNYTEDCFQQTQRFKKSIPEILPLLLSEFQHFADLKNGKWGMEWDITLHNVEENFQHGIRIAVPLKRHNNEVKPSDSLKNSLRLYTKILVLTTICKQPSGFDWKSKQSFAPLVNMYSEHDDEVYNDIPIFYDCTDGTELVDDTLIDNSTCDDKANTLLLHANESEMISPLLSVEHHFSQAWQLHEFSYSEVIENIDIPNLFRVD